MASTLLKLEGAVGTLHGVLRASKAHTWPKTSVDELHKSLASSPVTSWEKNSQTNWVTHNHLCTALYCSTRIHFFSWVGLCPICMELFMHRIFWWRRMPLRGHTFVLPQTHLRTHSSIRIETAPISGQLNLHLVSDNTFTGQTISVCTWSHT